MTNQDFKDILKAVISSIKQELHNITTEPSPIGEIIAFMGTKVPEHYLACNGAQYTIGTYPLLEEFFVDQFGSVNYFGGDGIKTFKVPDLRGEFLRGTGTATRATGSGAGVGLHQNPTKIPRLVGGYTSAGVKYLQLNPASLPGTVQPNDEDILYNKNSNYTNIENGKTGTVSTANAYYSHYTSRPTNTSVLYCIKYESSNFDIEDIIGGGGVINIEMEAA